MKKIIIVFVILGLILLVGCDEVTYDNYNEHYFNCAMNTQNQFEYCQCWSDCRTSEYYRDRECHQECSHYWEDMLDK